MILCSRQLGPLTNPALQSLPFATGSAFRKITEKRSFFFRYGERERRDEATKDLVHQVPDPGA